MTIYRGRSYLEKHRFVQRTISSPPSPNLGMVITIPCHDESQLIRTLDSLEQCQTPPCGVDVLIVVNASPVHPEKVHLQNLQTAKEFQTWKQLIPRKFTYYLLHFPDLPPKHAGVGLARKIAMDEAVDRLEQVQNPQGIILGLDADSLVQINYLVAIYEHFSQNPQTEAASIHFEHPLSGTEYEEAVYQGILRYELFLRYYIEGLRYAQYPFAYHTIGSSMAVRSVAYQKQGGMNRRKAGEDFYFLQKFISQGTLSEISSTCVIPSPRPSHRVPFGTGKAISDWLRQGQGTFPTYDPQSFEDLYVLCSQVPDLYTNPQLVKGFPQSLHRFFEEEGWEEKLEEIRLHVSSNAAFVKRFYQRFDALSVLKFVHFCRDQFYPPLAIRSAATRLKSPGLAHLNGRESLIDLLQSYRDLQRKSTYFIGL